MGITSSKPSHDNKAADAGTGVLNPHRHTKIWLSPNPDVFLNPENQLRLVKMRTDNPTDLIHFIFAKALLSENALKDLVHFCSKHHIRPIALEEEVFPQCSTDPDEASLANLCQEEIRALGRGGNLGAASDMLRWVKPVYSLGVYSDFDVTINTNGLPETISVAAPILMKLGSLQLPIAGLTQNDLETIALNNDSIAVVGDDPETYRKIKNIQRAMVQAYTTPNYEPYYDNLFTSVSQYVSKQTSAKVGAAVATSFLTSLPDFACVQNIAQQILQIPDYHPIAIRRNILERTIPAFKLDHPDAIAANRKEIEQIIQSNPNMNPNLRAEFSKRLTLSDAAFVQDLEESRYAVFFKATVINTTGPLALSASLFEKVALSASEVDRVIAPFSFQSYGLDKAFFSLNHVSFHSNSQDILTLLESRGGKVGCIGDAAWTAAGAVAVKQREQTMDKAARTLQRCVRNAFFADVGTTAGNQEKTDIRNRSTAPM